MNKTDFTLEGYIHNPGRFEQMHLDIKNIWAHLNKGKKLVYISIVLALLSLFKAFWSHIFLALGWIINKLSVVCNSKI